MSITNFIGKTSISLALIFLFVLTYGCKVATTSNVNSFQFQQDKSVDKRNFVLMKDSTIIYGNKVSAWEGLFAKQIVRIDGKEIPVSEIRGFQEKGVFFARIRNGYAKRIKHGRISIYRTPEINPGRGYSTSKMLVQKGSNGALEEITSFEEIKALVSDCPKAYNMINITTSEYTKSLKKDFYLLDRVIDTYNKCGEWN